MRPFLFLCSLFTAPAFAAGELQLQSSMPVVMVLDGKTVGTVQPLEPLLVDITPGVHNLKLQGLLGKDLYDRDLIFDDHTRTELHWQNKELRLGKVVALDPNRPADAGDDTVTQVAEDAPPAVPHDDDEHGQVADEPEVVAAAVAPERPALARPTAPPVAAPPAPVAPPAAAPPAPIAPPAAAPPAAAPPARAAVSPRAPADRSASMVIQATENLDLQITHGTQVLRVRVENGELVVEDARGTKVVFPGTGPAW